MHTITMIRGTRAIFFIRGVHRNFRYGLSSIREINLRIVVPIIFRVFILSGIDSYLLIPVKPAKIASCNPSSSSKEFPFQ